MKLQDIMYRMLVRNLPGDFVVRKTDIKNNNQIVEPGVELQCEGNCCRIRVSVVKNALENGAELDNILSSIVSHAYDQMPALAKDVQEKISVHEDIKCMILGQLINVNENEEFLQNYVYRKLDDLALIYRIVIQIDQDGIQSIPIFLKMLEQWGINEESLYKQMISNMEYSFLFKIRPLQDVLCEYIGTSAHNSFVDKINIEMLMVSNRLNIYGASAILNPQCLNQCCERLNTNKLCIIPSSIHEVLVFDFEKIMLISNPLNNLIREINRNYCLPEEILSNHAYVYDMETNVFSSYVEF